ncbi:MAG: xanthine dehydrogenase accessory factor [Ilumatobacteraceae bacterium]|jgi:xanthine dehydrogenase accessory factor
MTQDLSARASELRRARAAYVHARVVVAEKPTSAKPGAEAIVLADGTIEGFVGGACAESTVRAQALALLDNGETLLLRITPEPEPPRPGSLTVHNPCLSGGTLEVFLEPVIPAPLVVVAGDTPIARALLDLVGPLGHAGMSYAGTLPADAAAVVVATHGRDEEMLLRDALLAEVPYVGLVASRKRGEAVLGALDICGSMKAQVHTPAGLDIGARTPEEVALSILAEIISTRPRQSGRPVGEGAPSSNESAIDPVCGMTVAMVDASLHLDHEEHRYWFCGSGCLRAFNADPHAYLS